MYSIQLKVTYPKDPYGRSIAWPVSEPDWKQVEVYKNWCKEYVGANQWNYYGAEKKIPFEFRFKKSEDLLAFKLKFLL